MPISESEKRKGGGPWRFEPENDLAVGETWLLDFQNMEFNGQGGWFRKWIPLDMAQVTNQNTGEAVIATYNGQFEDLVLPNSVETFDRQAFNRVAITNDGDNIIPAGDLTVTVKKEPYGADEKARENASRGQISGMVEHFTGVKL